MSVERIPAFLIAEIAFLVSLTSAARTVSAQACQCLRQLAKAERKCSKKDEWIDRLTEECERNDEEIRQLAEANYE